MKHSLNILQLISLLMIVSCSPKNLNGIYQNQYSHKLKIKDSTFQLLTYDGMNGTYYCNGIIKTKGNSIILKQNAEELKGEILNVFKCDSMILNRKNVRKLSNEEYTFKRKK